MRSGHSQYRLLAFAACAWAALACNLTSSPTAASPTPLPTLAPPLTATVASVDASPASATAEPPSATPTLQPAATAQATATSSGPLKGTAVQRSNCRYGPGAYYLYKIGLREGAPIEVLGRTVDGGWALVQYAGTENRCWINAKLIQVTGDLMSLPDAYQDSSSLPRTSKFGPVSILSASGDAVVNVEWTPVVLPPEALPGENEVLYVIEVWTCLNGSPAFYTLGTNETSASFDVDSSCGVVPRADIVAQNKLGVSGITPIPIP